MLEITLRGAVALRDETGQDLTPRGQKTRGLIALLAFSKDFRRSRAWLQDKLWSDRAPEQAAGSLRQALTELRKAVHPHDILISRSGWVQLDPDKVSVSLEEADAFAHELCEDLNIRDAEFENWLRDTRQQMQAASPPPPMDAEVARAPQAKSATLRPVPVLVIQCEAADAGSNRWVQQLLRDDIVRTLFELGDLRVLDLTVRSPVAPQTEGPSVFLKISEAVLGDKCLVSLSLETLSGHWTIWQSPAETVNTTPSDAELWRLRSLAQTCVATIQNEFERQGSGQPVGDFALALANRALRALFQFGRQDLIDADLLLKAAYKLDPKGVYLSWRAFIRNTAIFEHLTDDFLEPCEAYDLHATALADDPMNSFSLVFAGQHSYVNEGDPRFGQQLCDRALEINPGNAMGWAFRSGMLILQGQSDLAAQAAQRGQVLAQGQPCRISLALHTCIAEMSAEHYASALNHARMAQMWGQKCQAVRRFLFVLYKAMDMPLDADKQLAGIQKREPDFSSDTLLRPDYPTWTLQRLKIADVVSDRS